ncbi:hypothetical protein STANM309S_05634 [Streptomyces tanashiensis]
MGREKLREAATTEPGRLQILGAVLALLVVAFGAVTALEVTGRASAADQLVSRSQPLSADAAAIYRSLADADTTAASGFGGHPAARGVPRALHPGHHHRLPAPGQGRVEHGRFVRVGPRDRHAQRTAPALHGPDRARPRCQPAGPSARRGLSAVRQPADVQRAAAGRRAAVRGGDRAAPTWYYDSARAWPFLSLALGLLALGVLVWAQRRNYARTNRVFNHGLLAATAATVVVLLWLLAAHTVTRAELNNARAHGQESLQVLNTARISSPTARANENLTLVARAPSSPRTARTTSTRRTTRRA